jgi:hypothetical protein
MSACGCRLTGGLSTLLLSYNRRNRFKIGASANGRISADFIKSSGFAERN